MKFNSRYSAGFFGGVARSTQVPNVYHVSLNGRVYMIDLKSSYLRDLFRLRTVTLLRSQADQGTQPSEQSINPEDLWRRSHESWHHGAGQTNFDRPDSDPYRYRTSKGVDVWTRYELGLLNDTSSRRTSANTNLRLAAAGSRLYLADGTGLLYSTDAAAWTTVTGTPGVAATGIASDGFTVYTTHAASGIYSTNTGSGASASFNTRVANGICAYVKGRLIVSNDNVLVNITGGAAETILLTHPNTGFRWVGAAPGPAAIYAAGFAGDKSLIYRTAVKADGTALDIAAVAGELPDGEIVRAIEGYLGFLLVGSDKGVRLVELDSAGNVASMSDIVPTGAAVQCFEPQDRFVWYGLTNLDAASTGLGRLDLSQFTQNIDPAYAPDLMAATTQGAVLSAATFGGVRLFTVSGVGVFGETATKVTSGTLDSGLISYGLSDKKVALSLDVRHEPLTYGTHKSYVSADGSPFKLVGQHMAGDPEGRFVVGQVRAETFEIRAELDRDATVTTAAPTLTRWTLFAEPAPPRSRTVTVPLVFHETILDLSEGETAFDINAALDDLDRLVDESTLVGFQFGDRSYSVFVKDYDWAPLKPTADGSGWQGTCSVTLKVPAG